MRHAHAKVYLNIKSGPVVPFKPDLKVLLEAKRDALHFVVVSGYLCLGKVFDFCTLFDACASNFTRLEAYTYSVLYVVQVALVLRLNILLYISYILSVSTKYIVSCVTSEMFSSCSNCVKMSR